AVPVPVVIAAEHAAKGPATERQRHAARPRLDQPPGEQELVQVRLALALVRVFAIQSVAAAAALGLAAQVKGMRQARGGKQVDGLLLIAIDAVRGPMRIHLAAKTVEAGQEGAAVGEAARVD